MDTKMKGWLSIIGVNIRCRRNNLNYSQEYMGYKLNISQNAYSKIELNQTKLTVQRLYEIAVIFEITPIELMGFLVVES